MSILDEIDSGLDIDALRDVAAAVNGLKKPGNSVLMVTHYKVGWEHGQWFFVCWVQQGQRGHGWTELAGAFKEEGGWVCSVQ